MFGSSTLPLGINKAISNPTIIKRSVGDNTKNMLSSEGVTAALDGDVLILSEPQTHPDIGMGDEFSFVGGRRYYIYEKVNHYKYIVRDEDGTYPSPIINNEVAFIRKTNPTIQSALSGLYSQLTNNDTSDFDMVSENYAIEIFCYNNQSENVFSSTTTGPISINSTFGTGGSSIIITSSSNSITIKTPIDGVRECNFRQRHYGRVEDSNNKKTWGYALYGGKISISIPGVKIEGLTLKCDTDNVIEISDTNAIIQHNIIINDNSGNSSIKITDSQSDYNIITDNIFYGPSKHVIEASAGSDKNYIGYNFFADFSEEGIKHVLDTDIIFNNIFYLYGSSHSYDLYTSHSNAYNNHSDGGANSITGLTDGLNLNLVDESIYDTRLLFTDNRVWINAGLSDFESNIADWGFIKTFLTDYDIYGNLTDRGNSAGADQSPIYWYESVGADTSDINTVSTLAAEVVNNILEFNEPVDSITELSQGCIVSIAGSEVKLHSRIQGSNKWVVTRVDSYTTPGDIINISSDTISEIRRANTDISSGYDNYEIQAMDDKVSLAVCCTDGSDNKGFQEISTTNHNHYHKMKIFTPKGGHQSITDYRSIREFSHDKFCIWNTAGDSDSNGPAGIYLNLITGIEVKGIQFRGCEIGFYHLVSTASNLLSASFEDNLFYKCGTGISLKAIPYGGNQYEYKSEINIKGNIFDKCGLTGIQISQNPGFNKIDISRYSIRNNTIINNKTGISVSDVNTASDAQSVFYVMNNVIVFNNENFSTSLRYRENIICMGNIIGDLDQPEFLSRESLFNYPDNEIGFRHGKYELTLRSHCIVDRYNYGEEYYSLGAIPYKYMDKQFVSVSNIPETESFSDDSMLINNAVYANPKMTLQNGLARLESINNDMIRAGDEIHYIDSDSNDVYGIMHEYGRDNIWSIKPLIPTDMLPNVVDGEIISIKRSFPNIQAIYDPTYNTSASYLFGNILSFTSLPVTLLEDIEVINIRDYSGEDSEISVNVTENIDFGLYNIKIRSERFDGIDSKWVIEEFDGLDDNKIAINKKTGFDYAIKINESNKIILEDLQFKATGSADNAILDISNYSTFISDCFFLNVKPFKGSVLYNPSNIERSIFKNCKIDNDMDSLNIFNSTFHNCEFSNQDVDVFKNNLIINPTGTLSPNNADYNTCNDLSFSFPAGDGNIKNANITANNTFVNSDGNNYRLMRRALHSLGRSMYDHRIKGRTDNLFNIGGSQYRYEHANLYRAFCNNSGSADSAILKTGGYIEIEGRPNIAGGTLPNLISGLKVTLSGSGLDDRIVRLTNKKVSIPHRNDSDDADIVTWWVQDEDGYSISIDSDIEYSNVAIDPDLDADSNDVQDFIDKIKQELTYSDFSQGDHYINLSGANVRLMLSAIPENPATTLNITDFISSKECNVKLYNPIDTNTNTDYQKVFRGHNGDHSVYASDSLHINTDFAELSGLNFSQQSSGVPVIKTNNYKWPCINRARIECSDTFIDTHYNEHAAMDRLNANMSLINSFNNNSSTDLNLNFGASYNIDANDIRYNRRLTSDTSGSYDNIYNFPLTDEFIFEAALSIDNGAGGELGLRFDDGSNSYIISYDGYNTLSTTLGNVYIPDWFDGKIFIQVTKNAGNLYFIIRYNSSNSECDQDITLMSKFRSSSGNVNISYLSSDRRHGLDYFNLYHNEAAGINEDIFSYDNNSAKFHALSSNPIALSNSFIKPGSDVKILFGSNSHILNNTVYLPNGDIDIACGGLGYICNNAFSTNNITNTLNMLTTNNNDNVRPTNLNIPGIVAENYVVSVDASVDSNMYLYDNYSISDLDGSPVGVFAKSSPYYSKFDFSNYENKYFPYIGCRGYYDREEKIISVSDKYTGVISEAGETLKWNGNNNYILRIGIGVNVEPGDLIYVSSVPYAYAQKHIYEDNNYQYWSITALNNSTISTGIINITGVKGAENISSYESAISTYFETFPSNEPFSINMLDATGDFTQSSFGSFSHNRPFIRIFNSKESKNVLDFRFKDGEISLDKLVLEDLDINSQDNTSNSYNDSAFVYRGQSLMINRVWFNGASNYNAVKINTNSAYKSTIGIYNSIFFGIERSGIIVNYNNNAYSCIEISNNTFNRCHNGISISDIDSSDSPIYLMNNLFSNNVNKDIHFDYGVMQQNSPSINARSIYVSKNVIQDEIGFYEDKIPSNRFFSASNIYPTYMDINKYGNIRYNVAFNDPALNVRDNFGFSYNSKNIIDYGIDRGNEILFLDDSGKDAVLIDRDKNAYDPGAIEHPEFNSYLYESINTFDLNALGNANIEFPTIRIYVYKNRKRTLNFDYFTEYDDIGSNGNKTISQIIADAPNSDISNIEIYFEGGYEYNISNEEPSGKIDVGDSESKRYLKITITTLEDAILNEVDYINSPDQQFSGPARIIVQDEIISATSGIGQIEISKTKIVQTNGSNTMFDIPNPSESGQLILYNNLFILNNDLVSKSFYDPDVSNPSQIDTLVKISNNTIMLNNSSSDYGLGIDNANSESQFYNNLVLANNSSYFEIDSYISDSNYNYLVNYENQNCNIINIGDNSRVFINNNNTLKVKFNESNTLDSPYSISSIQDLLKPDEFLFLLSKRSEGINDGINSAILSDNDITGTSRPSNFISEVGAYETPIYSFNLDANKIVRIFQDKLTTIDQIVYGSGGEEYNLDAISDDAINLVNKLLPNISSSSNSVKAWNKYFIENKTIIQIKNYLLNKVYEHDKRHIEIARLKAHYDSTLARIVVDQEYFGDFDYQKTVLGLINSDISNGDYIFYYDDINYELIIYKNILYREGKLGSNNPVNTVRSGGKAVLQ